MLELLYSLASLTSLMIFAVTLLVVYVIKSWLSHPSDLPPMPRLPVPILGHILYLKPSLRDALNKWTKDLMRNVLLFVAELAYSNVGLTRAIAGDIFSIYFGSKLIIVISSQGLLKDSFVHQGDWFSDRPETWMNQMWKELSFGIAGNSGPSWKEQRTVSMSILREFGMGKNWLAEKISQEVKEYVRVLENMQGKARDLQLLTSTALSNIICAILLGERFEYDDPFLTGFVKQNIEQLKLSGKTVIATAFPWVRFLPGDSFHTKELYKMLLKMNTIFSEKFINKTKQNVDDSDNFIKAYIREMYKRKNSDLNETHLRRIIDVLFIAGTDTTSTTLIWAFGFCVHYPESQKKVCITENQVNHLCSKTTTIGGYRIPEGATILPYLDAVLKDEKVWKDPDTFRPERFLDQEGNVIIPDEFVPFSLGRRICMGEALAKMELFLFLSIIFQRFEVLPEDPNNLPPLVTTIGFTSSLTPFKVRMKPRPRL